MDLFIGLEGMVGDISHYPVRPSLKAGMDRLLDLAGEL